MPDTLIGKKLGDYEIQKLLGKGGMARVYLGFDGRLERRAAVKVINNDISPTERGEYFKRFQNEARAIAKLEHPNIVSVYQFGEYEDVYYMAMAFVEGHDLKQKLRELIDRREFMPLADVVNVIRQIGSALDYAHSKGVIHRDVKPSNIMLNDRDNRAVLTDFGLALTASDGTLGETFGSAHYIAPEQAVSSAKAVAQSDLYSLGVCTYEMLTGKVPFDDPSAMSVALKHLNDEPPLLSAINPTISPVFENVIAKILSKEPSKRYRTGMEYATALQQALVNAPQRPHTGPTRMKIPPKAVAARVLPDEASTPTPVVPPPGKVTQPASLSNGASKAAPSSLAKGLKAQTNDIGVTPPPARTNLSSPAIRQTGTNNKPITPSIPVPTKQTSEMKPYARPEAIPRSRPDSSKFTTTPKVESLPEASPGKTHDVQQQKRRSILPLVIFIGIVGLIGAIFAISRSNPGIFGMAPPDGSATAMVTTLATTDATAIADAGTSLPNPDGTATPSLPTSPSPNATATKTIAVLATQTVTQAATQTTVQTRTQTTTPTTTQGTAEALPPIVATITPSTAVASEGVVLLVWDTTQFVLVNRNSRPLSVRDMEFEQRGGRETRRYSGAQWVRTVDGRPTDALASGQCYQLGRFQTFLPAPLPPCSGAALAYWQPGSSGQFWLPIENNPEALFDVIINKKTITTCQIAAGSCQFTAPTG